MKKLAGILLAVCMMFSLPVGVCAVSLDENSSSGNTVIHSEVPDTHTVTVDADSADIFLDGKQVTLFRVDRLSEPRLLIRPQANQTITQVLVNDHDVTDALIGGYLNIAPVHEDIRLTVLTETAEIVKPESIVLRGVLMSDGKPLAGVTLVLHSEPKTCVTDANGAFAFEDAEIGHHTLSALHDDKIIGYCELTVENGDSVVIESSESGSYILSSPEKAEGLSLTLSLTDDGKLQPTDIQEIASPFWEMVIWIAIGVICIAVLTTIGILVIRNRKKK